MQKWTSSTCAASGAAASRSSAGACASVSLRCVVSQRHGPLNEVECWAVLSQAGSAIQDLLLGINNNKNNNNNDSDKSASTLSLLNRKSSGGNGRTVSPALLVITPDRLLCTASGKVSIEQAPATISSDYVHPSLRNRLDLTERELEALGIYSLGKTITECLEPGKSQSAGPEVSQALRSLLSGMTKDDEQDPRVVTLFSLLHTVSEQWRLKVGSSPISRFVSQLCRVTLGWQVRPYQQGMLASNHTSAYSMEERKRRADEIRTKWLSQQQQHSEQQQQQMPRPPALSSPPTADANFAKKEKMEEEKEQATTAEEEVEFSRLDTSCSSSNTNSASQSPKLPSDEIPAATATSSSSSAFVPDLSSRADNNWESIGPPGTQDAYGGGFVYRRRVVDTQANVVRRVMVARRAKNLEAEDAPPPSYQNVPFADSNLDKAKSVSEQNSLHHHHHQRSTSAAGIYGRRAVSAVSSGRQTLPHHQAPTRAVTFSSSSRQNSSSAARTAENNPFGASRDAATGHLKGQTSNSGSSGSQWEGREESANSRNSSSNRVRRNPSRLYRVVRPLAQVTPTPSPATKRCVGPEFVVMAAASEESGPVFLDLSRRHQAAGAAREATVVMLGGQRIVARVSPHSVTAGEVLDNVLSNQDIKESCYYCLALKSCQDASVCNWVEYWPLSNDCKLSRVAPPGWKDSHHHNRTTPISNLTLYLRLRFVPDSVDGGFRDPNNKHQLYLQLRRDVLEGRCRQTSPSRHLALAGLALQTEFGDFSDDIHSGEYFLLEHYLPQSAVLGLGGEAEARRACVRLHRSRLGQSQSATEVSFCREVQATTDDHGCHCFSVREHKKEANNHTGLARRHLGIHLRGLRLFETSADPAAEHRCLASFAWRDIVRIQYDKCRFQLAVQQERGGSGVAAAAAATTAKLKFYVPETKAKVMFDLASAHHQFYLQQKWNSGGGSGIPAERRGADGFGNNEGVAKDGEQGAEEKEEGVEYRQPREKTIRSLKNRLLSRRQLSQRKLYTRPAPTAAAAPLPPPPFAQSLNERRNLHQHQPLRLLHRRRLSASASTGVNDDGSDGRRRRRRSVDSSSKLMVKRLTHYTSMADAVTKRKKKEEEEEEFNSSNKENRTPNRLGRRHQGEEEEEKTEDKQSYRYKVYLEPEEDVNPESTDPVVARGPLQEKPIASRQQQQAESLVSPPPPPLPKRTHQQQQQQEQQASSSRPRISTTPSHNHDRRRSDNLAKQSLLARKVVGQGRRSIGGLLGLGRSAAAATTTAASASAAKAAAAAAATTTPRMRMGTRTSMSALHRERLRLTGTPMMTATTTTVTTPLPPAAKKRSLDLDYDAMEVKSILPFGSDGACVVEKAGDEEELIYDDGANESLSESLLERFDALEPVADADAGAGAAGPGAGPGAVFAGCAGSASDYATVGVERQIVPVSVCKDPSGRLGLKITGTPGGIYVDGIDRGCLVVSGRLQLGDRLVAVNGRSLENVSYAAACELVRRSDKTVHFLVSQIKTA